MLDQILHALLKFVTDKTVSRLIKVTKGHTSKHPNEIKKRHRSAKCSSDLKMSMGYFLPGKRYQFIFVATS